MPAAVRQRNLHRAHHVVALLLARVNLDFLGLRFEARAFFAPGAIGVATAASAWSNAGSDAVPSSETW